MTLAIAIGGFLVNCVFGGMIGWIGASIKQLNEKHRKLDEIAKQVEKYVDAVNHEQETMRIRLDDVERKLRREGI